MQRAGVSHRWCRNTARVGRAVGGLREAGRSQVTKVLSAGPRGPGSGFSPNPPSLRAPEMASLPSTVAQTVKKPPANAGDPGWIPGWGRSPGEGNCSPFQYSCLGKSMVRGAWRATVHGVAKSWTWPTDSHFPFPPFPPSTVATLVPTAALPATYLPPTEKSDTA